MISSVGRFPRRALSRWEERQGKRKMLKEYDEKSLLDAITQDYKKKFLKADSEAAFWKVKANNAISIYLRDHPKPIEEDDL